MPHFDLPELTGGRVAFRFKSTDPNEMITLWAHHPSPEELAAAMRDAGVVLNDKGEMLVDNPLDSAPRMANVQVLLADLCIDAAEALDGWPDKCRCVGPDGLERLTPAAQNALPRIARRKVGEQLMRVSEVSDSQGEPSGPQPTGLT